MTRLLASLLHTPSAPRAEPVPSCDELERMFRRVFGEFAAERPGTARLGQRR
jgi:hypothetical protein